MDDARDLELVARLDDLARVVRLPAGSGVSSEVAIRLRMERVAPRRGGRRRWIPVVVAALAPIVAMAVVLGASAGTRRWIADRLSPGHKTTVVIGPSPSAEPIPYLEDTPYRSRTPLSPDEAMRRVEFDVLLPDDPELRTPAFGYVGGEFGAGIALAWSATDELPPIYGSGFGLFLVETPGTPDGRTIGDSGSALDSGTEVTVGGAPAIWTGATQEFIDPNSGRRHAAQWASSALIWQVGGLTLRLESSLDKEGAISIAETIHP